MRALGVGVDGTAGIGVVFEGDGWVGFVWWEGELELQEDAWVGTVVYARVVVVEVGYAY